MLAKVCRACGKYQSEDADREACSCRGPVKSRLGYRPYERTAQPGRGGQQSGASSSASIFQQVMDKVLEGIENVTVNLDDVWIAGKFREECYKKLLVVLDRLAIANINIIFDKYKFFVNKLTHVGHLISDKGLMLSKENYDNRKGESSKK